MKQKYRIKTYTCIDGRKLYSFIFLFKFFITDEKNTSTLISNKKKNSRNQKCTFDNYITDLKHRMPIPC